MIVLSLGIICCYCCSSRLIVGGVEISPGRDRKGKVQANPKSSYSALGNTLAKWHFAGTIEFLIERNRNILMCHKNNHRGNACQLPRFLFQFLCTKIG